MTYLELLFLWLDLQKSPLNSFKYMHYDIISINLLVNNYRLQFCFSLHKIILIWSVELTSWWWRALNGILITLCWLYGQPQITAIGMYDVMWYVWFIWCHVIVTWASLRDRIILYCIQNFCSRKPWCINPSKLIGA